MDYVSILMVFAVSAVVAGAPLGIPGLIAPKRISAVKQAPFECGKDPVMLPEGRFAIKFSTIAIFFILFGLGRVFCWPGGGISGLGGCFGLGEIFFFRGSWMPGSLYMGKKR